MFNTDMRIVLDFFLSEILNIILVILFVLVGGVLPLWERNILSLIQRRVGPKFIGYNGRLQFIADALKVFFNDYIVLFHTNSYIFFALPVLFLNLNLLFWLNLVFFNNSVYVPVEYNLVFLLIFSTFSNLFIFFVGIFNQNKYTIITSNRILNMIYVNELFISLMLSILFLYFNSFSFNNILFFNHNVSPTLLIPLILPLIFYMFLLDVNNVPFDMVEAESELIMGYHIEYSGFLFGLFVLVEYLHLFFFIYIMHLLLSWI